MAVNSFEVVRQWQSTVEGHLEVRATAHLELSSKSRAEFVEHLPHVRKIVRLYTVALWQTELSS